MVGPRPRGNLPFGGIVLWCGPPTGPRKFPCSKLFHGAPFWAPGGTMPWARGGVLTDVDFPEVRGPPGKIWWPQGRVFFAPWLALIPDYFFWCNLGSSTFLCRPAKFPFWGPEEKRQQLRLMRAQNTVGRPGPQLFFCLFWEIGGIPHDRIFFFDGERLQAGFLGFPTEPLAPLG